MIDKMYGEYINHLSDSVNGEKISKIELNPDQSIIFTFEQHELLIVGCYKLDVYIKDRNEKQDG